MGLRRIVYPAVFRDRSFRNNPTEGKVVVTSANGEDRIGRDISSTEWAGFKLGGGLQWNDKTGEVTFKADGAKINVGELFNGGDATSLGLADQNGFLKPLDDATRTAEIANAKDNAVASTTLVGRSVNREDGLGSDGAAVGTPAWVWVILVVGALIAVSLSILGVAIILRARANAALAQSTAAPTFAATEQHRKSPYVRKASSRRSRYGVKH